MLVGRWRIVIRPINRQPGEFSVEILRDLVSQGYSGDELVKRFEPPPDTAPENRDPHDGYCVLQRSRYAF
jgi:hypothetical protein